MIYIPFIYFSCLALWTYTRRHVVDMATICSLMFALSGFFSILVDADNLRYWDSVYYEITPTAAATYCGLLTLCILPMTRCDVMRHVHLQPMRRVKLLKWLAVYAMVWFLSSFVLGWDDMMRVLTGDMRAMKTAAYHGMSNETWMQNLPAFVRYAVFDPPNVLFSSHWTLLFVGLYSMMSPRLPFRYSCCFLIASLWGPVNAIIGLDRAAVSYWIMAAGVLWWIFRRHLPAGRLYKVNIIGMVALGLVVAYLAAMTIQRFGGSEHHQGSEGSMIVYLGQPYINFCCFFDTYRLPFQHFGILFPMTSWWVFNLPSGGVPIQMMMTELSGMRTGVFYTFIGHIMIGIGQSWAVGVTLAYALVSWLTMRSLGRKKSKSALTVYLFFFISSVVLLGPFAHFYAGGSRLISAVLMYFLVKRLQ